VPRKGIFGFCTVPRKARITPYGVTTNEVCPPPDITDPRRAFMLPGYLRRHIVAAIGIALAIGSRL
jgi:hypothetical protein